MKKDAAEEKNSHSRFAKSTNQEVWKLLEKSRHSEDEKQRLIHAAHASCYHWSKVGGGLQKQRANWLISRVYVVAGDAPQALQYARICLDLTKGHSKEMMDFDLAYAYEAMARASLMNKRSGDGKKFFQMAKNSGDQIKNEEDRNLFFSDFKFGGLYQ